MDAQLCGCSILVGGSVHRRWAFRRRCRPASASRGAKRRPSKNNPHAAPPRRAQRAAEPRQEDEIHGAAACLNGGHHRPRTRPPGANILRRARPHKQRVGRCVGDHVRAGSRPSVLSRLDLQHRASDNGAAMVEAFNPRIPGDRRPVIGRCSDQLDPVISADPVETFTEIGDVTTRRPSA